MCIAAAIIGAGVVGAAGTAIAGGEAAGATTSAANTAAGVQEQALSQEKQLSAPYTGLGQAAIPQYEALLGIGPQGSKGIQSTLQNLPGYQFAQQQGTQNTENAAASMGLGLSGNTLQGLSQFNSGLANQNYNQYLNQLMAPVQLGQAAAAGQAANIQTGASNLGNIAVNQGNNLAGIYANEAAGLTGALGNTSNQLITQNTLQGLMGGGGGGYNPNLVDPGIPGGTQYATPTSGGGFIYSGT
jgi:hypothetical protein